MGRVTLNINNRTYPIACDDGEEDRIAQLGSYLNAVVRNLTAKLGAGAVTSDSHLLVMAGLTIADELSETYEKLEAGETAADEAAAARALDRMATRLEGIAARLENL